MTLPQGLDTFKITWKAIAGVTDSPNDADDLPDILPVGGTVTFTPRITNTPLISTDGNATLFLGTVTATVGADGILVNDQGDQWVRLICPDSPGLTNQGWTWQATFKVDGYTKTQFDFTGTADQTYDLAELQPVAISTGTIMTRGPAGTVDVGTVTTGAAGTQASVVNSGTPNAAILDFTIPKGDKGDQGIQGAQGLPGDLTPASNSTIIDGTLVLSSADIPSTMRRVLGSSITVSFSDTPPATESGTITLELVQDPGGAIYDVTWPAGVTWVNDAPGPAMSSTANSKLMVHLFWTGAEWLGVVAGLF